MAPSAPLVPPPMSHILQPLVGCAASYLSPSSVRASIMCIRGAKFVRASLVDLVVEEAIGWTFDFLTLLLFFLCIARFFFYLSL